MEDANDFAFYLACALPFAILLWRDSLRWRPVFAVAAAIIMVAILATFSRGAILGVIGMVPVALVMRLVRPRHLVAALGVLALLVGIGFLAVGATVQRSLDEKQHVADANVASRFATWSMAAEMTADHPVLGTGPGGFRTNFVAYQANDSSNPTHYDVVHQMFLDVSAELGLLGLAAFLALLAAGGGGAVRAVRSGPDQHRLLAAATCVSLFGTVGAATFLSEQYYLPIWMLAALGAALDPGGRTGGPRCA
nr:O-antigen ligase family protein [Nocardioides daedukensis]